MIGVRNHLLIDHGRIDLDIVWDSLWRHFP
jgi:uncharacterized protein with HEPN domain